MSGGMEDARAVDDIASDLQSAVTDLAEAIHRAEVGHRGVTVNVIRTVNGVLSDMGVKYRLVTYKPAEYGDPG